MPLHGKKAELNWLNVVHDKRSLLSYLWPCPSHHEDTAHEHLKQLAFTSPKGRNLYLKLTSRTA